MRLIDFVKANLNKNWSWWNLSRNPSITLKDVIENPELNWSYFYMSLNPLNSSKFNNSLKHEFSQQLSNFQFHPFKLFI